MDSILLQFIFIYSQSHNCFFLVEFFIENKTFNQPTCEKGGSHIVFQFFLSLAKANGK